MNQAERMIKKLRICVLPTRNYRDGIVEAPQNQVAMTLFFFWGGKIEENKANDDTARANAAGRRIEKLESDFGTWRVAVGRNQSFATPGRKQRRSFSRQSPSFAIPGVSGGAGAVFTFYATPERGQKRRYGVAGGTYVSVVEFAPKVRGLSVHVFGASGHPENRHYTDQSPLYARGEFKPAWLTIEEIKANLERAYRPGEEKISNKNN
jgi:acyl-homoserine-lactone acylase